MPLYFATAKVGSDISLQLAWTTLKPLVADDTLENPCRLVLATWAQGAEMRRYESSTELAKALKAEITGKRENYFFGQAGENLNIETVIFRTVVPADSIGWTETKFFQELGHPGNRRWRNDTDTSELMAEIMRSPFISEAPELKSMLKQGLRRRAEQEYLLANMVKGAMWDAAEVAEQFRVGIAVRGTGVAAHMGIESGDPTKAQEFKNKTSKDVDLVLCEEMEASQVGAVVHYDPRVEWNSRDAETQANLGKTPMFNTVAQKADWDKKKLKLNDRIGRLGARFTRPSDAALEAAFFSRSKEYMEEDHEYRKGHYAPYTKLVGPYVRLKVRSDVNMVGDHDLFAFTDPAPEQYGIFLPDVDPRVAQAQRALQNKETFQAQHGGIWYWEPGTTFNVGIKAKIMGAHGPEGDEPLVYIRPGKQVTAAYFTSENNLKSVWADAGWTKWLAKTHSGKLL